MLKNFLPVITILFILLPHLSPPEASAGDVTLSITTVAKFVNSAENRVSAEIVATLANSGNEAATDVSLRVTLAGKKAEIPFAARIEPGETVEKQLSIPLSGSFNGSYPIFVDIVYRHSDGNPVSASTVSIIRTDPADHDPAIKLDIRQKPVPGGKKIKVIISADPSIREVNLSCRTSDDLIVPNERLRVIMAEGKGDASFIVAPRERRGRYAVNLVAEAESGGRRLLSVSSLTLPFSPQKFAFSLPGKRFWQWAAFAASVVTLFLTFFSGIFRKRYLPYDGPPSSEEKGERVLDKIILALCTIFILANMAPQYLLTPTITTGGDTASHYYTLDYLRHTLLPQGKITGWTMGNYAGFPILQFYFPLPFLLASLLGILIPLQAAFKIVTLLGSLLMPTAVYLLLRALRRPFPAPALGAIFTIPFLFHSGNSMWGGNLLSTLAGEFSYSLSFSLSLILIGTLFYGARRERWLIRNAILVFLVGFSHGYTLLFVEALSLFFLITTEGFLRRLFYLIKVYALGFLLLAFWLVPLLLFTRFTTSYHLTWIINSWKEVLPVQILLFAVIGGVGALAILFRSLFRRPERETLVSLGYLIAAIPVSILFFIAAPEIGVVDIRYIPYAQITACVISAFFLGWLARFLPGRALARGGAVLCMIAVFFWVGSHPGPAPDWARWNYEGFEPKPAWPLFRDINESLRGGFNDPRVMYEHSEDHNIFGSSRAFESLPLFAGRATLEGLYMQASISAPFIFYLQSEVSSAKSAPFPQYTYSSIDFKRALPHLLLFNTGDLIIRSDGAKRAIRAADGYSLEKTLENYELWKVTANSGRYVEPLKFEPVLFRTDNWKRDSFRWFMNYRGEAPLLVFSGRKEGEAKSSRFRAESDNLASISVIPIDTKGCIVRETVGNDRIRIETNWIGKPLLVKVSYHPNWKVEGADKIYLVSPSFMLIYPASNEVLLYYGRGFGDYAGAALSIAGLVILLLNIPIPFSRKGSLWRIIAKRAGITTPLIPVIRLHISLRKRRALLASTLMAVSLSVVFLGYRSYTDDINRVFNRGIKLKDAKKFDEARESFGRVIAKEPFSNLAQDSLYYISICHYLEKRDAEAIASFSKLVSDYPVSLWIPESLYHIGLCQERLGLGNESLETMRRVVRDYPGTPWAIYAANHVAQAKEVVSPKGVEAGEKGVELFSRGIELFNGNRDKEAKAVFEKFLSVAGKSPDAPQALACLALIAYRGHEYGETIRRYREMIDRYPGNRLVSEGEYHIGLSYEALGMRREAEAAFRSAARESGSVYGRQAAEKLKGW